MTPAVAADTFRKFRRDCWLDMYSSAMGNRYCPSRASLLVCNWHGQEVLSVQRQDRRTSVWQSSVLSLQSAIGLAYGESNEQETFNLKPV